MSVDFFECEGCGVTVCECGSYVQCNDECGHKWCTLMCAEKNGGYKKGEEDATCKYCRHEDCSDWELLNWFLEQNDSTREEAVKEYFRGLSE